MVEILFMVVFIGVLAWALFLTNVLAELKRNNNHLYKNNQELKRKYAQLEEQVNGAYALGKQAAYNDMKEEIKKTIREVHKND